jgi:hypothetical protein
MKRSVLSLVIAVGVVGVGLAPAAANAWTASGHTINAQSGQAWPFVLVNIHNDCTGANGSTSSNSSGFFSFINVAANCFYTISSQKCIAHSLYVGNTRWYQPSSNVTENLYLQFSGLTC